MKKFYVIRSDVYGGTRYVTRSLTYTTVLMFAAQFLTYSEAIAYRKQYGTGGYVIAL